MNNFRPSADDAVGTLTSAGSALYVTPVPIARAVPLDVATSARDG